MCHRSVDVTAGQLQTAWPLVAEEYFEYADVLQAVKDYTTEMGADQSAVRILFQLGILHVAWCWNQFGERIWHCVCLACCNVSVASFYLWTIWPAHTLPCVNEPCQHYAESSAEPSFLYCRGIARSPSSSSELATVTGPSPPTLRYSSSLQVCTMYRVWGLWRTWCV